MGIFFRRRKSSQQKLDQGKESKAYDVLFIERINGIFEDNCQETSMATEYGNTCQETSMITEYGNMCQETSMTTEYGNMCQDQTTEYANM